jgi:hypothetical protein
MTTNMTRPTRPSRKSAFTDDEEKIVHERDKMDDVLDTLTSRKGEARLQSVPPLPASGLENHAGAQQDINGAAEAVHGRVEAAGDERTDHELPPDLAAETSVPQGHTEEPISLDSEPGVVLLTGVGDQRDRKTGKATGLPRAAEEGTKKPPAAWISSDVYSRLVEYSDKEKRTKRAAARPFGVIAMDAIENHAAALAVTWKGSGVDSRQAGTLFVRELNSRYRRHELPPRSITLQGVGPENAKLLKRLKKQWGAGSVSDLVEKALRLEFEM